MNNILKDIKYIKSSLNSERKHILIQQGDWVNANHGGRVTINTNTNSTKINYLNEIEDIPQGTANGERVGDSIRITNLSYKMKFILDDYNNRAQNCRVKVYLCALKDANSDLITGTSAITNFLEPDEDNNYSLNSYFKEENYKKFTVLGKHNLYFNQQSFSGDTQTTADHRRLTHYIDNNISLSNRRMMLKYNTDGTLSTNKLFFIVLTDNKLYDNDDDALRYGFTMKTTYVDN